MRVRTHPGEILRHEYLDPLEMSATALAQKLDVPANRITDIVRGRRDVTADTALRLAAHFETTPEFWMNLQTAYDLSKAQAEHGHSRIMSVQRDAVVARAHRTVAKVAAPAPMQSKSGKGTSKKVAAHTVKVLRDSTLRTEAKSGAASARAQTVTKKK